MMMICKRVVSPDDHLQEAGPNNNNKRRGGRAGHSKIVQEVLGDLKTRSLSNLHITFLSNLSIHFR